MDSISNHSNINERFKEENSNNEMESKISPLCYDFNNLIIHDSNKSNNYSCNPLNENSLLPINLYSFLPSNSLLSEDLFQGVFSPTEYLSLDIHDSHDNLDDTYYNQDQSIETKYNTDPSFQSTLISSNDINFTPSECDFIQNNDLRKSEEYSVKKQDLSNGTLVASNTLKEEDQIEKYNTYQSSFSQLHTNVNCNNYLSYYTQYINKNDIDKSEDVYACDHMEDLLSGKGPTVVELTRWGLIPMCTELYIDNPPHTVLKLNVFTSKGLDDVKYVCDSAIDILSRSHCYVSFNVFSSKDLHVIMNNLSCDLCIVSDDMTANTCHMYPDSMFTDFNVKLVDNCRENITLLLRIISIIRNLINKHPYKSDEYNCKLNNCIYNQIKEKQKHSVNKPSTEDTIDL